MTVKIRPRDFRSAGRSALIVGLIVFCAGLAAGAGFPADAESELKARIQSFWEAMMSNNYGLAAQYIHPESRDTFLNKIPKTRYEGWKLDKLEFNAEMTSCKTLTYVKKSLPPVGAKLDWPLHHIWVLEMGEWFLTIRASSSRNPMLELFKGERETAEQTRAMVAPKAAPTREMTLRAARILGRFTADASNPSVMNAGRKEVFRFSYINDEDVPIRIVSVHADCHCTAVKQDYPELKPGEQSVLEVTLDAFGLPLGRIEKDVQVEFSDFPEPVTLRLSVENKPNFVLIPGLIDFGALRAGAEIEKQVRILNESGKAIKFLPMTTAGAQALVSLDREALGPGEAAICTVRYKAGEPGEILGSIMLRTDLESEPLISLRIAGKVIP